MKTAIFAITAAVSVTAAIHVQAGPSTLAGCYDLVIDSCNANSNHPQACASSGMDQCDKQFRQSTRPADTAHGSRLTGIRAHKPIIAVKELKEGLWITRGTR